MTYTPRPLDTGSIPIDPTTKQAIERVAEHLHELWSQRRINEGWQYGPKRDEDQKMHPCLVPYADLPENEREYDRQSATGTIRALLAMGYRLMPPGEKGTP